MLVHPDLIITGTLIGGPRTNLVALAGLKLSDDAEQRIWERVSPRRLLVDVLGCEEVEVAERDDGPGLSDSVYEYRCGPRAEFIARLREVLLEHAQA
jgi:hypothetical protein